MYDDDGDVQEGRATFPDVQITYTYYYYPKHGEIYWGCYRHESCGYWVGDHPERGTRDLTITEAFTRVTGTPELLFFDMTSEGRSPPGRGFIQEPRE